MIDELKNAQAIRTSGTFPKIRNRIHSIFGFRPSGEIIHKDVSTAYVGGYQEDEYYFTYDGLDFAFYVGERIHLTVRSKQCFDINDLIGVISE